MNTSPHHINGNVEVFGLLSDGKVVERVRIKGGGLVASILTWGAVVQDLRLTDHAYPLVLGLNDLDSYVNHSPYYGAIAGRCINRIRDGHFSLDGHTYEVDRNFRGKNHLHCLHGGAQGMGKGVWQRVDRGADFVTLEYHALDGEMGFPGNLDVTCTYSVRDNGHLVVDLSAETSRPTLCNLGHHSYFNLDDGGSSQVFDHKLQIDADHYLPTDEETIPTGELQAVSGTPFDFRQIRTLGHRNPGQESRLRYDHNFCLGSERGPVRQVACAEGSRSGVVMEVWTSETGLQFFDGIAVPPQQMGLDGITYGPHTGFCLEAQAWPNAINQQNFPEVILRPDERYHQVTEYRFHIL